MWRHRRLLGWCLVLAVVYCAAACKAKGSSLFSDLPVAGAGGAGGAGGSPGVTKANSVDLLLVIDNSRSMGDKQALLGLAIPDLIEGLVNPLCVDETGVPIFDQPGTASEACSAGSSRLFDPIEDIHVGVITTSLGGHGADACDPDTGGPEVDDKAHLITRGESGVVETFDDLGFLVWEPGDELSTKASDLVLGAGQEGCGFEASLESWYRFLVDPDPYERIDVDSELNANPVGTDQVLLAQRKGFLRPDSLLVILTLSDENDCSIRDGGQAYFAAQLFTPGGQTAYRLPRARAACATDPQDPCCVSCGQPTPDGCSDAEDMCDTPLVTSEDHVNVRCWQQKRRFGIDFMWPMDRYTQGLSSPQVADRHGNVVANPLFVDLDPNDSRSSVRDPRLVFFSTLAGVPWQDIARQTSSGTPDLNNGENSQGRAAGGFQTAAELASNGTWEIILGDPLAYVTDPKALPEDPLMIESIDPRTGTHPLLDEDLAPVDAAVDENSVNGHERTISSRGDLQYACIFALPEPIAYMGETGCECSIPEDNPLCQQSDGSFGTSQLRSKAYPGLRQLQLVKLMESQAALGSVCPVQIDEPSQPDFGYRPFVRSLVESVAPVLETQ